MASMFMGNSLWELVRQSDGVSQFVLVLLLVMSVACWAVFVCKAVIVHLKKKHMAAVLKRMNEVHTVDDMLIVAAEYKDTLPGYFLSKNLLFLQSLLKERQSGGSQNNEMDLMQQSLDQTLDDLIIDQEAYLPLLSTSASVAPLLGLFGTVWGLVHAFIRISQEQVATITTVAPGIAEALITTLAGLVVAIPAMVMYNYLGVQVRSIENSLTSLADKMSCTIQKIVQK